jgi:hypothetical protein
MSATPVERLIAALDPGPHVADRVAAQVAKFAAELADVDLLDLVATEVQHPTGLLAVEVVERSGITYRQLDYWTAMGYLSPIEAAPGSGHPRTYLPREIVKARLMGSIVTTLDVKAGTAAVLADEIMRHGAAHVGDFTIARTAS